MVVSLHPPKKNISNQPNIWLTRDYPTNYTAYGGPEEAYTLVLSRQLQLLSAHSFTDKEGDNGDNQDD